MRAKRMPHACVWQAYFEIQDPGLTLVPCKGADVAASAPDVTPVWACPGLSQVDHRVATHKGERRRVEAMGALIAPIDQSGEFARVLPLSRDEAGMLKRHICQPGWPSLHTLCTADIATPASGPALARPWSQHVQRHACVICLTCCPRICHRGRLWPCAQHGQRCWPAPHLARRPLPVARCRRL